MTATDLVSVEVPDIGDFADVPVIEILVSPGDTVAADDPLVTLESDKATMDVPAPFAGTIRELHIEIGDKVSQGSLLLTLEPSSDAGTPAQMEGEDAAVEEPAPASNGGGPIYASPSVRRLAREHDVDLATLSGTGRKGRITRQDVERVLDRGPAAASPTGPGLGPVASGAAEERVALSRIQKIAGPRLTDSWTTIPHVTHNEEADITELEAWRKQLNAEQDAVKLTMVSFLVCASVRTLKEFPTFNSSLDGEELVLKRYYNIGFAADTPHGLLVPVIKDADRLGLLEIARQLTSLSAKAREGKLSPSEMQGATFTISSLGGIGGTSFTPIINAPEVAILGVTRAAIKPVWNGSEFVPRLIVPLSLSYDHRVIDGAAAARFVSHLGRTLSDLRRALL